MFLVSRLSQVGSSQALYFQIEVDSGTANGSMDSATIVLPRLRASGTAFALTAASADGLTSVTATTAEFNRLAGVTDSVQSQLNAKVFANQQCSTGEYLRGFDASGTKICVSLPGNVTVTKVDAGVSHGCAVLSDSTAMCTGYNSFSALGDGSTTQRFVPVYVRGSDGAKMSGISQISIGYYSGCVLKTDGTLWCWGYNGYGNVGNNSTTAVDVPTQIMSSVAEISYGTYEACARKTDGSVWCWGRNNNGQLGDGSYSDRYTPTQIAGLTAVAINQGSSHACAVLTDGTMKCWGYNGYGGLGDGTTTGRTTPVTVTGLTGVTAVSRFRNTSGHSGPHTCAIKTDRTVWCWGYNGYAQLAIAAGDTTNRYTATLSLVTGAVKVAGSTHHNCAVIVNGDIKCWGYNGYGNLGVGDTTTRHTPTLVLGVGGVGTISGATDVSATGESTYNWTNFVANGKWYSMGANDGGQFGNNTSTSTGANSTPKAAQAP
jgi:alpha-tubulin suppressor-like RCC1 family protein